MLKLRWVGLVLALLTLTGQAARFAGNWSASEVRPLDDVVASLVLIALFFTRSVGPAWHAAGWGLFAGVHLTTLVVNLDAWLRLGDKPNAPIYVAALAVITLVAAGAAIAAARRAG